MPRLGLTVLAAAVLAIAATAPAWALVAIGGLSPPPGRGGCVRDRDRHEPGQQACGRSVAALSRPEALAVSPGGRAVYVASQASDSVVALTRDPAGGGLAPGRRASTQSCIRAAGSSAGCIQAGHGLRGADALALGPRGTELYVGSIDSAAVVALTTRKRGLLRAVGGRRRCVQGHPLGDTRGDSCPQRSDGLAGVVALAVSPDGRNVYAASVGTAPEDQTIVGLRRRPDGGLEPLRGRGSCVQSPGAAAGTPPVTPRCSLTASGIRGPSALLVSPDGRFVYVASALSSAVAVFGRDPRSGRLAPLGGPGGCLADVEIGATPGEGDCRPVAGGLGGARSLALSPDGRELYVASLDPGAVAVLTRDTASGTLSAAPGACVAAVAGPACATVDPDLRGSSALVCPGSGKAVYVAAQGANAAVALARDSASGALTPVGQPRLDFGGFNGPAAIAASPDGHHVYLASPFDDALLALGLPVAQR